MKRKVIISFINDEYDIDFIQADGKLNSSWTYHQLINATDDIAAWLKEDSSVKDKSDRNVRVKD